MRAGEPRVPRRILRDVPPCPSVRRRGRARSRSAAATAAIHTNPHMLVRIARVDVLVLGAWEMPPIHGGAAPRHARDHRRTLRLSGNSDDQRDPARKWRDLVGDPTTADAICDCPLQNAHRVDLKGPSRRKRKKDSDPDKPDPERRCVPPPSLRPRRSPCSDPAVHDGSISPITMVRSKRSPGPEFGSDCRSTRSTTSGYSLMRKLKAELAREQKALADREGATRGRATATSRARTRARPST